MGCTLHHIHLVCRDLQPMIDFLTANFDAKFISMQKFGGANPDKPADGASLDLGGTMVNLRVLQEKETLTDDASIKTYGLHHIGINVSDLDKIFKELSGKGFTFPCPPRKVNETTRTAFVEGPDNVTFELIEKKG